LINFQPIATDLDMVSIEPKNQ